MTYDQRKNYINNSVVEYEAARKVDNDRHADYKCHLKTAEGAQHNICDILLLSMLGYSKTASIIDDTKKSTPNSAFVASPDICAKHKPAHASGQSANR